MSARSVLLKRGVRSDRLWTSWLLYRPLLRDIPITLDARALWESQYWPREEIEALQDARIKALLESAAVVPFWKARFAATGVDVSVPLDRVALARLPVTSKKDFSDLPIEEYTDMQGSPLYWADHTSGSTGTPAQFLHDVQYELRHYAMDERMFRVAGGGKRLPVVSARTRYRPRAQLQRRVLFPLFSYNNISFRIAALQELLASFPDGVILHGLSSMLMELGRLIQEQHLKMPVHAVMAIGEGLTPAQREYLSGAFSAEVFTNYAAGETEGFAYECESHRLHVNEEWVYIEIVDEQGNQLTDGSRGRIVMTNLDNRVMPFIRYDTGDLGVMPREPCPCGRALRCIQVTGRSAELIRLPAGREVPLIDVASAFVSNWEAIRQYQIVQTAPDHFVIRIVPKEPLKEEKRDLILSDVLRKLGPNVYAELELKDWIPEGPGGKAVYFVRSYEERS